MILERKDTLSIRPAFPLKTLFENIIMEQTNRQTILQIDFWFILMTIKDFQSYMASFCINSYWRPCIPFPFAVMEDRFNEIERERNALKTKLLTADVEQEMKAKCISKLSKQHRTEVRIWCVNILERDTVKSYAAVCIDYRATALHTYLTVAFVDIGRQVTRLLNENHSLTTQLRDSVSRISALESQVSISEEESKKLVELHLSDQVCDNIQIIHSW